MLVDSVTERVDFLGQGQLRHQDTTPPLQMRQLRHPRTSAAGRLIVSALATATLAVALGGCAGVPKIAKLDAVASDFQGEWTGTYTCPQGVTGVRLSLVPQGPSRISGTFDLFPVGSNPGVPSGTFEVAGTVGPMGKLELAPGAWIIRAAPNYVGVRVSASLFSEPPAKMIGRIPEPGCSTFEVTRTSATVSSPLATRRPAANPASTSAPAPAARAESTAVASSTTVAPVVPTASAHQATPAPLVMKHSAFVKALGSRPLKSMVGTTLDLNLRRGGDGGWAGYIEDPQSLVFFTCARSAKDYVGGPTVSKVTSLRSNDNGVFVTLDRCGAG